MIEFFQRVPNTTSMIKVDFTKIIDGLLNEEITLFYLNSKRTYTNIIDVIISNNNIILNECDDNHETILSYLNIKFRIDNHFYKNYTVFLDDICDKILTKKNFIDKFKKYISNNYEKYRHSIEKSIDVENIKFDESLVFGYSDTITIYEISNLYRFIIPLITHYIYINNDCLEEVTQDLYANINSNVYLDKTHILVAAILKTMESLNYMSNYTQPNIYTKLENYILNMVRRSKSNNKGIWEINAYLNINEFNFTKQVLFLMLTDILPKSTFEKSIITLINTCVKNQIKIILRQDFGINFKTINLMDNDENFSEADIFEMNSAKINDTKYIMQKLFVNDTILKLCKDKQICIDINEYNWYFENFTSNPINRFCIEHYFSKYLGGIDNINHVNKYSYIILLIILLKELQKSNKYIILPYIISGKMDTYNEKRVLNKSIYKKLHESPLYETIMSKYKFVRSYIDNSDIILKPISTILNNKFVYNHYKYSDNGKYISINTNIVIEDVLYFIASL